jgi:hypothetical protein
MPTLRPQHRPRLDARLHAMRARKRGMEISDRQRALFAFMGLFQFALLVAAQADLFRRSSSEVRGPKWVWRVVAFVNFIGPLTYFAFGRTSEVEPEA